MLLDLLFPKTCLSCGKWGKYICFRCQKQVMYINGEICLYCRRPSYLGFTHEECKRQNGVDGALSILNYNGVVKRVIKGIKYRLVKDAFRELFLIFPPQALSNLYCFRKIVTRASLQPIPLHPNRQAKRGFNQSKTIGLYFSHLLNYPVVDQLWRIKDTMPQAQTSSREERHSNIHGAFESQEVAGSYILVDDVLTSGYTCLEAARELKGHGASAVYIFTLARGLPISI